MSGSSYTTFAPAQESNSISIAKQGNKRECQMFRNTWLSLAMAMVGPLSTTKIHGSSPHLLPTREGCSAHFPMDLRKAQQCVKTHAFRSRSPPSLCLPQVQQQSSSLAIAQATLAPAVCQLTTFGKGPLFVGVVRIHKTPWATQQLEQESSNEVKARSS